MNLVLCNLIVVLAAEMAQCDVIISKIKLWGDDPSVEVTVTNDSLVSPAVVVYQNLSTSSKIFSFTNTSNVYSFANISIEPGLRKEGAVVVYNATESNNSLGNPLFQTAVVYVFNTTDEAAKNMIEHFNTTLFKFTATPVDDQFLYLCNGFYRLTNLANCSDKTLPVSPEVTTIRPSTGKTAPTSPRSTSTGSSSSRLPTTSTSTKITTTNASSTTLPTTSTKITTTNASSTRLPTTSTSTKITTTNASSSTTLPTTSTKIITTNASSTTLPTTSTSTKITPTNASSTTLPTTSTSTKIIPTNASSTETSPTSGTTTQSKWTSLKPSVTSTNPHHQILINEVNLLLAENDFFIELKGLSKDTQNVSVVVFDAEEGTCLTMNSTITPDASGFAVLPVTEGDVKEKNAFVVALFDTTGWTPPSVACPLALNRSGLMDVLIISKHMDIVDRQVVGMFTRDSPTHLMVVDPDQIAGTGQSYSISRCAPTVMDSGAFIISHPSRQAENRCKTGFGNKIQLKLKDARCKDFQTSQAKQLLLDALVYRLADSCSCGISPLLFKCGKNVRSWCDGSLDRSFMVDPLSYLSFQPVLHDWCNKGCVQKFHCGSLIFESFLEAVNQSLAHKMFISYNALIESSPSLTVGNATYQVDIRCNNDCLTAAGAKQGNIKQTIAVVVSCLVAFLVIVIVVVVYLKKKRRGVLQFRMTRLDEDDDDLMNPDMDDFVGSQDASFENKLYTRFSTK